MENDFERDERQERPNSWWRVVAPSLAFAGVQASWAVQIGHGSAHLRKLGLKSEWVRFFKKRLKEFRLRVLFFLTGFTLLCMPF
jgi:hypothetical protein